MSKPIVITKPITRIGGHAKLTILLGEDGVEAHFNLVEFRGFEILLRGRRAEEAQWITSRICGICHTAHTMASVKAVEDAWRVKPPEVAEALRRIAHMANIVDSHILMLTFLVGPDIVRGRADRKSFVDLLEENPELVKTAVRARERAQKIHRIITGRGVHAISVIPGGLSKPLSVEEAEEVRRSAKELLKDVKSFVNLMLELIEEDEVFRNIGEETYYVGLVGPGDSLEYYEGEVRILNPDGSQYARFRGKEYIEYIEELVKDYNYAKYPVVKGLGIPEGVYRVGPLARLNVSKDAIGDEAKELRRRLWKGIYSRTRYYNIARLIEILDCAERIRDLCENVDITSSKVRAEVKVARGEGVGIVEAPRGLLIHHYKCNEYGIIEWANIITPTAMFTPAVELDLSNYLSRVLEREGMVTERAIRNALSAIRDYDPCIPCATHNITVEVVDRRQRS